MNNVIEKLDPINPTFGFGDSEHSFTRPAAEFGNHWLTAGYPIVCKRDLRNDHGLAACVLLSFSPEAPAPVEAAERRFENEVTHEEWRWIGRMEVRSKGRDWHPSGFLSPDELLNFPPNKGYTVEVPSPVAPPAPVERRYSCDCHRGRYYRVIISDGDFAVSSVHGDPGGPPRTLREILADPEKFYEVPQSEWAARWPEKVRITQDSPGFAFWWNERNEGRPRPYLELQAAQASWDGATARAVTMLRAEAQRVRAQSLYSRMETLLDFADALEREATP